MFSNYSSQNVTLYTGNCYSDSTKGKKKKKERFKTPIQTEACLSFVLVCVFLTFKIFIFRPFCHYRGQEQRAVNDTQEMSRARLEPRPLQQSLSKCGSPALWAVLLQTLRLEQPPGRKLKAILKCQKLQVLKWPFEPFPNICPSMTVKMLK